MSASSALSIQQSNNRIFLKFEYGKIQFSDNDDKFNRIFSLQDYALCR